MISEEEHKSILENSLQDMLKTLTSSRQLAVKNFFEMKKVPRSSTMLDLLNFLRNMKLNFVVSIHKRSSIEDLDMRSYLIGVHNITEFLRFKNMFDGKKEKPKISGHKIEIVFLKRTDFRMYLTLPPADEQIDNIDSLSTVIKFNMRDDYNKFLPTIRLIEFLIEVSTLNMLNAINGIALQYNAGSRLLKPCTYITSSGTLDNELELIIEQMSNLKNTNVEIMIEKIIVAHESIWSNEEKEINEDRSSVYILSSNLIKRNVLTNGKDVNSLSNYVS